MAEPESTVTAPPRAPFHAPLDAALAELEAASARWLGLGVAAKLDYARALVAGFARVAAGQVEAAVAAKGAVPGSTVEGEEWLAGPYINLRTTRLLIESLEHIRAHGHPRLPPARRRANGQVAVAAFPVDLYDRLLYGGFRAEVWMQPAVELDSLSEHVGGAFRRPPSRPRVALVLGAGNVASIGPLDVVSKLFFEGQVALLKLNPVNDYLAPFIEDAFRELIADGFVRVTTGGADVGAYLCEHPAVDEIHITGSARTHDAIVYGGGAEGAERKRRGEPRLDKRITSELGNVSPVIVVPGEWSDADLTFQAENVATQMAQNGGFNCNAAKVVVTWEGWPQRRAFLDQLEAVLASLSPRRAYYPGARERYERFTSAYPSARAAGRTEGDAQVPPTLARGVTADDDGPAFEEESFCSFSVETPLSAPDPAAFLERAVEFCNERLYGTLNASLIVHPDTRAALAEPVERAIENLRYGTVAINHWPALAYGFGSTPWGAYPGHTLDDIQSGIGVVHNTLLLEDTQKCVVDGPFRVFPKPAWFLTHRRTHAMGPLLARLEAGGGPLLVGRIVLNAIRG